MTWLLTDHYLKSGLANDLFVAEASPWDPKFVADPTVSTSFVRCSFCARWGGQTMADLTAVTWRVAVV